MTTSSENEGSKIFGAIIRMPDYAGIDGAVADTSLVLSGEQRKRNGGIRRHGTARDKMLRANALRRAPAELLYPRTGEILHGHHRHRPDSGDLSLRSEAFRQGRHDRSGQGLIIFAAKGMSFRRFFSERIRIRVRMAFDKAQRI